MANILDDICEDGPVLSAEMTRRKGVSKRQLRTTLRTYALVGVTGFSSACGFGCSNLLLIKQFGA